MHERALNNPTQWAALSERMLRFQGQMPPHAAILHLEAAAAVASVAFRVDTRRGIAQKHAQGPDVRRLTGSGVLARSGARDTTWLLRHLRAFADFFPTDLMTVGHSTEQRSRLAAPKHLRSLWVVCFPRLRTLVQGTAIHVLGHRLTGALMLHRALETLSAHG